MSKIIMSIFFLGLTAYVSRSLGVESFGNAQYITWLVATIWLVTNFGLPNTIVRYIALFRNEGLDRDVSSLIRLFFLSTVFFLILGTIGIVLFYKGATIRIILVGLLFLSTSLNNFFQSTAEGLKAFKSQLYATILSSTITALVAYPLIHHMQLNGYIAVLAINSLVSALVLGRIVTKRGIMTSNSFRSKEQLKDIVRFTFFAWLASILSAFMWQRMEIYFIQRFLSSLDVAFFSIAISLSTLITQPIGLLSSAIRPYFSVNHNTLAGTVRQENIYCFLTKISAWLTFFFCFIIAAQSRFFVSLVYGEAYLPAWQVVAIVVAGSSFGTIASVGSSLVLGYGKSKFIALSSMIGAALAIGVGFMIIPVFGIIGASISRVIIQILMIGLGTVYIYIYLKVPFPFTSYFKSMFLSLLIATMFYLLCKNAHQILVILYCLISFLLYILLSHLVKVFSQEDYMYVKTALKAKGIIRSRKNKELI